MTNRHLELVLIGHDHGFTSLAFSADGKTLVSGSYENHIVWDVETGKVRWILRAKDFINHLAVTPDGAAVTSDGHVKFFAANINGGGFGIEHRQGFHRR